MEQETYYIVVDTDTGITAKGTGGYGSCDSTLRKTKRTPPKLYTIGSAKSVITQKRNLSKYYKNIRTKGLRIIPVSVTFGEPIDF